MYRNILIATDGSELSAKAADAAIELAHLTHAHLYVLSVAQELIPAGIGYEITVPPVYQTQFTERALAYARDKVDIVIQKAQSRGVAGTGLWMVSTLIANTIVEQANKHDCQLIVMASHGRKGLERLLMGSETLHVLTHSKISTLVVR